jgi:hypothetical protein
VSMSPNQETSTQRNATAAMHSTNCMGLLMGVELRRVHIARQRPLCSMRVASATWAWAYKITSFCSPTMLPCCACHLFMLASMFTSSSLSLVCQPWTNVSHTTTVSRRRFVTLDLVN